jgi:hypothetical protein
MAFTKSQKWVSYYQKVKNNTGNPTLPQTRVQTIFQQATAKEEPSHPSFSIDQKRDAEPNALQQSLSCFSPVAMEPPQASVALQRITDLVDKKETFSNEKERKDHIQSLIQAAEILFEGLNKTLETKTFTMTSYFNFRVAAYRSHAIEVNANHITYQKEAHATLFFDKKYRNLTPSDLQNLFKHLIVLDKNLCQKFEGFSVCRGAPFHFYIHPIGSALKDNDIINFEYEDFKQFSS